MHVTCAGQHAAESGGDDGEQEGDQHPVGVMAADGGADARLTWRANGVWAEENDDQDGRQQKPQQRCEQSLHPDDRV